jgi:hypothetical protein
MTNLFFEYALSLCEENKSEKHVLEGK